jgi:alanine dehydrogenase
MTSVVARSATHALTNAAWHYIAGVAEHGIEAAVRQVPGLRRGIATHQGHVVNAALASHLGVPEVTL